MKHGQYALIIVMAFAIIGTIYLMGVNHGYKKTEQEIELAYEAAAQSYKNALQNDSTRYDTYGNEIFQREAPKYVLPENLRTKSLQKQATKTEESKTTRKRTF